MSPLGLEPSLSLPVRCPLFRAEFIRNSRVLRLLNSHLRFALATHDGSAHPTTSSLFHLAVAVGELFANMWMIPQPMVSDMLEPVFDELLAIIAHPMRLDSQFGHWGKKFNHFYKCLIIKKNSREGIDRPRTLGRGARVAALVVLDEQLDAEWLDTAGASASEMLGGTPYFPETDYATVFNRIVHCDDGLSAAADNYGSALRMSPFWLIIRNLRHHTRQHHELKPINLIASSFSQSATVLRRRSLA
ncbi:hypothetical protein K438DRAFT_1762525 [Mycena galopus ATCC 62051]|nr:hypothetical protein K438DRAFT_1762525 [Mycena galopus ATCC 62051]